MATIQPCICCRRLTSAIRCTDCQRDYERPYVDIGRLELRRTANADADTDAVDSFDLPGPLPQ
jgi:hypothetical protein